MKRVFATVISVLLLCAVLLIPAVAAEKPRLVDGADLLNTSEAQNVEAALNEVSERQNFDVVIVTVDSLDGASPMAYADDYFDYNGYGMGKDRDGALLLIAMESRDWWISTRGYGITALTDYGIDYIGDQIVGTLGEGEYESAFLSFAAYCDDFVRQARTGKPYDTNNAFREPFDWTGKLLISFVVALVIALIAVGSMTRKMKSVRAKESAADYTVAGSLSVSRSHEQFLYRNVSRTARAQSSGGGSSTHSSSSGASHGGGGGKF